MDYIKIPNRITSIFITFIIILVSIIGFTVIPTEVTVENRPLLWGIMTINLLFATALFLLLYFFNTVLQGNIFHVSMIFTFLVALPITLYNLGVTSILFSN